MTVAPAELMTAQPRQLPQHPHRMDVHLLANPGDSLLLQHTLDHLIRWLYPSMRIFHVSERASSFRTSARVSPVAGKRTVPGALPIFTCNLRQIVRSDENVVVWEC